MNRINWFKAFIWILLILISVSFWALIVAYRLTFIALVIVVTGIAFILIKVKEK
nr:MAG TPA: zinc-ribbon containing domain protein [Caudoviricetes sp.]